MSAYDPEKKRRYYEANKEIILARKKERRARDKEKIREYQKDYQLKTKEARRKYAHDYYLANKEAIIQKVTAYKRSHQQMYRDISKKYYWKYKDASSGPNGRGEGLPAPKD